MNNWDEMVSEFGEIPLLPGARCRGRWELFDATITGHRGGDGSDLEYARNAALQLCTGCPALDPCRDWLASLPASQRPLGVTAGQLKTDGATGGLKVRIAQRAEHFEALRQSGMSLRQIAETYGTSLSTVRYTLKQEAINVPLDDGTSEEAAQ